MGQPPTQTDPCPPAPRPDRSRLGRAISLLFLFCLLNAIWSLVGGVWSICLGGERYANDYEYAYHQSGLTSRRGYLIIELRESLFMKSNLRGPKGRTVRERIPWYVGAYVRRDSRTVNGILDDHRPRRILPGLVVNWQPAASEWHNRGVAIHWWLLTAATGIWPLVSLVRRYRRRVPPGHCPGCGYDLRATPEQCPECGRPVTREDRASSAGETGRATPVKLRA